MQQLSTTLTTTITTTTTTVATPINNYNNNNYYKVEHFVNSDVDWDPELELLRDSELELLKALYWYRLGNDSNTSEREQSIHRSGDLLALLSTSETIQIENNTTRGVTAVKVMDSLLRIRAEWIDGREGGIPEIDIALGHDRYMTHAIKGAVERLLKEQVEPPIGVVATTVEGEEGEEEGVRLKLNKEDVWCWFKSDQAHALSENTF